MAATLFKLPKVIVFDANAALESGAKANFYITGTSTRQNTFTDKALTIAHDNPVVADGNGVFAPIYLDDTLNYKVDITDALDVSLSGYPVDNLASSDEILTSFASTANALGASLIGIEDVATNFIATDVEAALAEILSDLASTANTLGASLVGIEDAAGDFTSTTVEAVLLELLQKLGVTKVKTSTTTHTTDIIPGNDSELTYAIPTTGTYAFELFVTFWGTDTGTQGINFNVNYSGQVGNGSRWGLHGRVNGASTGGGDSPVSSVVTAIGQFASDITTTNFSDHVSIQGLLIANTTGTIAFASSQQASEANLTNIGIGSYMIVRKLN